MLVKHLQRDGFKKKYPNAQILSERYIRDSSGVSVKDSFGSRRRLDFVVVEDGKVRGIFEVTSPTADKTLQIRKEQYILNSAVFFLVRKFYMLRCLLGALYFDMRRFGVFWVFSKHKIPRPNQWGSMKNHKK